MYKAQRLDNRKEVKGWKLKHNGRSYIITNIPHVADVGTISFLAEGCIIPVNPATLVNLDMVEMEEKLEAEKCKNDKLTMDCINLREFKLFLKGNIESLCDHNPHKSFAPKIQAKLALYEEMVGAISITIGLMLKAGQTHETVGESSGYMDVYDTGLSSPISRVLEDLLTKAQALKDKE